MQPLQPGQVLGGCRLESVLGRGATAETWAGHHLSLDAPVVLKVLDPTKAWGNAGLVERFLSEGRALARMSHHAVVRVYTAGQEQRHVFLILERLSGVSLRARLREGLPSLEEAVAWTARLAEGLAAVHEAGLVHRDVKPENVLFDSEGQPKLVDFGIVFSEGERDKVTVRGTPAYMSPEAALSRPLDGRSDLYALGVVLFELLCNRWPFNAPEPRLLLEKQVHDDLDTEPLERQGCPTSLIAFVEDALEKDPDERHPDGEVFAAELRAALEAASGSDRAPRKKRRRKRRRAHTSGRHRARPAAARRAPARSSSGSSSTVIVIVIVACVGLALAALALR